MERAAESRAAHPWQSNMRWADVPRCSQSTKGWSKWKPAEVGLFSSELVVSQSAPPSFAHLCGLLSLILSHRWPMTRCPYFLTSTPIALSFCFGLVYMWQISGAQVKYKSTAALTSRGLWFPFGPMPCNQSLLLFSFSSSSFPFWRRLQKLEKFHDLKMKITCSANIGVQSGDIKSDNFSLVFYYILYAAVLNWHTYLITTWANSERIVTDSF